MITQKDISEILRISLGKPWKPWYKRWATSAWLLFGSKQYKCRRDRILTRLYKHRSGRMLLSSMRTPSAVFEPLEADKESREIWQSVPVTLPFVCKGEK